MAKKKGMGTATWVLMILLVLSLGGFGVTQFGQSVGTVATVGEVEVTTNDYARTVQSQIRSFQEQTGQQIGFAQAQTFGLDRAALGQLLTDAAIENEALAIGLSAGDANVSAEIRQYPAFQDPSGAFDRQSYELALRQNDLSTGEFEERIRKDIAKGLIRRAVAAGMSTPAVFVDTLFAHARETRDVTWARLTEADLDAPPPEPTEAQLATYHQENAEEFTRPETKTIRYAWVTPDMLAPEITVDEAQIRTLYENRIDNYVRPERRLVERLVYATEAEAEAAKSRLDAGETDFDSLVAERGLDLSDVDLGDVARADLGAAADAVFALEEPGVVGPLSSDLGPALYRMNGILAAEEISFEEARDELATEAAADRARRMILDMGQQIEDLLAGGADMDLLAERTEMEAGRIDWNEDVFDGIAAYEGFRRAAAAAGPDDFPELVELEDGGIVALNVEEVRPPETIPLDEVRDEVAAAWRQDATEAALTEKAERMADELRQGREMAGMDLSLNVNRELSREASVERTPPDFTSTVFGMEEDGISVISADGDAWLIRLDTINEADPSTPEAQQVKAAFAGQVAQDYSNALTRVVTQALVEAAEAQVNSSAIQAVHAQLP